MSTDRYIHLGPYLRCPGDLHEVDEEYLGCPNPMCKAHGTRQYTAQYCGRCGQKYTTLVRRVKSPRVLQSLIVDLVREELVDPGGDDYATGVRAGRDHIWISNVFGAPDERDPSIEEYGFQAIDITPAMIAAEVARFEERFAKEIEVIRDAYGPGSAPRVCWGFIQYYK